VTRTSRSAQSHVFSKKHVVFRISGMMCVSHSLLFVFPRTFLVSICRFGGKTICVQTRCTKTQHFAHTQTSDLPQFASRHYTPPSHTTTPYQLIPEPTSRTLHPTITPSARRERNFCSIVFPKYSSQSRLHNSLTVEWERRSVNPQPWHQ